MQGPGGTRQDDQLTTKNPRFWGPGGTQHHSTLEPFMRLYSTSSILIIIGGREETGV